MRDNKFTQRGHCMSQLLNRLAGNGIRNNLAFAVAVLAIALLIFLAAYPAVHSVRNQLTHCSVLKNECYILRA